jgi:hypothetical protein
MFLTSSENWAERAAELGWDAMALFGCRRHRPLVHLGGAGDITPAIEAGRADALHVVSDPLQFANGVRINTLALGARDSSGENS